VGVVPKNLWKLLMGMEKADVFLLLAGARVLIDPWFVGELTFMDQVSS